VFEPNGEPLWNKVSRSISDFLLKEWQSGALVGNKPEEAYFVKCDRSTMTQGDIDNGRLIILIGVAMLRPAEFVIFRTGQWTGDHKSWMPDRYFFGGRLSSFGGDLSKVTDGRLYVWHRFGHFHYVVPVATGRKYTLKLHFMEHWFGVENGGVGGVGSRVFDVSCNGSLLLRGFDIFREAGSEPLVKSFQHIEPTPRAKSRSSLLLLSTIHL
jgi:malectin (di-glucose binding ER protein)